MTVGLNVYKENLFEAIHLACQHRLTISQRRCGGITPCCAVSNCDDGTVHIERRNNSCLLIVNTYNKDLTVKTSVLYMYDVKKQIITPVS